MKLKKGAKRGVVTLLLLTMLVQLGSVCAGAADTSKNSAANGTVDVWVWKRVDSQSDLPAKGVATPVLLTYKADGKEYYVDGKKRNSSSTDEFKFIGQAMPDGAVVGDKTFRTTEDISNMTLECTGGTDAENGNAKFFKIRLADSKSDEYLALQSGYFYTSSNSLADGHRQQLSALTKNEAGNKAGVSEGRVKLNCNIAGALDPAFTFEGSTVFSDTYWFGRWAMEEFAMYIATKETLSAITSDITIASGQVVNFNNYVYIKPGVTITIEKGGVLSVSGTLFNNGAILNNGGDIVVQKNAVIDQLNIADKAGGVIACDGGDLVIFSGGFVSVGKAEKFVSVETDYGNGFVLRNGSTCVNFGTLVVGAGGYIISGSTLDNRVSANMFFDYKVKAQYRGRCDTLTAEQRASVSTYDDCVSYKSGVITFDGSVSDKNGVITSSYICFGDKVLVHNEGIIHVGFYGRQISRTTSEFSGSGRIYQPQWAAEYVEKRGWYFQYLPSGMNIYSESDKS